MAEALPSGAEVETNASLVLETFVDKAYWCFSAQLGGFVHANLTLNDSHLDALDASVQELTQIVKPDGSQDSQSRVTTTVSKRQRANDSQATPAASGAAVVAAVERKQKPSGER